jgi:D-alanine-D-alanine ligase
MPQKKRIAVIFGGQNSEHEVSRASAQSILENINTDKYEVVMTGITKEGRWLPYKGSCDKIGSGEWQVIAKNAYKACLSGSSECQCNETCESSRDGLIITNEDNSTRRFLTSPASGGTDGNIDVIFPVLHGCNGEDGTIQGLLELAGIPYVGCGVLGSALGMDKGFAKIVFDREGIPQGKYLIIDRKKLKSQMHEVVDTIGKALGYPCFIKPCNAGSSVGVGKAHNEDELVNTLMAAAQHDRRIIAEEFIDGREIECAVLGNDEPIASTVGEIIPCREFYDYEAKYSDKSTSETLIPADIPEDTINLVRNYAVKAFKALDCCGLARVDFFVGRKTGEVFINEINTMPGFTKISMYPKLWEASGIPYPKLIERLIELAEERFKETRRNIWTQDR